MNKRRQLLLGIGAGAFAAPFIALAQQPSKLWRIGFIYNGSRQSTVSSGRYGAFLEAMRELGYVEGKNFVLVEQFIPDWDDKSLAAGADKLVRSNVDLIVATGGPTVLALKTATSTIPVVVTLITDPLLSGIAVSLARPGKNFTGMSAYLDEVSPKHIEFVKLVVPKIARVEVLSKKGGTSNAKLLSRIEAEAGKTGLQVHAIEVDAPGDLPPAFARMAQQRAEALIILGDSFFVQHARQIADAAIRHRLPSIYTGAEYPEAGGLMSYAPNFADNFRRAATFVDKILKGANAGDIPFEQPTRFYLTINKKTAKALGITLSNELLLRADKVIE